MAANIQDVAPYDAKEHFDRIVVRIKQTFNPLIEQLTKRRDTLCEEVAQLRDDFDTKESARVGSLKELEKNHQKMLQMQMKSNKNLDLQEKTLFMYQEEKQMQCIPTPLPSPSFFCPTLSTLESQIKEFGEIIQLKSPQHSEKKQPILTAGKNKGSEEELDVKAAKEVITVEENRDAVAVANKKCEPTDGSETIIGEPKSEPKSKKKWFKS